MLRLVHVEPEVSVDVSVDEYVPITIEIGDCEPCETLYWRAKPDKQTLVEVGLSRKSGGLRSFTVTAINPKAVTLVEGMLPKRLGDSVELLRGVPCFSLGEWQVSDAFGSRFLDEVVGVGLTIGSNWCRICFGENPSQLHVVAIGELRCLLDKYETLVGLEFGAVDDEACRLLRELAPQAP